ncbi:MarR family winged helix-turn-helix transcriptional regulator [Streptomyces pseudovenezuelae]|uniref:DNA-binding MarR family transcriptional regulator n=1 Tax=Streptomyces pseudovenezuelae TaxID=67350 RepID=A0ABT6M032_9ACTN|nr:DNA-binding MarR family transcriptional regulator [Streptomyces pseudovenezuelae]
MFMIPEEPKGLDADESGTWLEVAALMTRLPAALDAQLQRDAGRSHSEYMILAGLSMSTDRRRRMSELADFVAISLSRLSHTAKRLEKQGWLYRIPDPVNGRFTLAVLTDAGWEKVTAVAPTHAAEVRRLVFDPLTKSSSGT